MRLFVYNDGMKDNANTGLALLIIFIAGALAMWVIIRIADKSNNPKPVVGGSEASYKQLQQSILNK